MSTLKCVLNDGIGDNGVNPVWENISLCVMENQSHYAEDELSTIVKLKNNSTLSIFKESFEADLFINDSIKIYDELYSILEKNTDSEEGKLNKISKRSRFLTKKDVPRTLDAFSQPSKDRQVFERSLMNFLLISSCAVKNGYCQGWNFVAGSYLITTLIDDKTNFVMFLIALKKRGLISLYQYGANLDIFLEEFALQLEHCEFNFSSKEYSTKKSLLHMKKLEYGIIFALEWFTTCFTLNFNIEFIRCIQDLLTIGIKNILLRVGLAIIAVLEPDILSCTDIEKLQHIFKIETKNLQPELVIPVALAIHIGPMKMQGAVELRDLTDGDILSAMALLPHDPTATGDSKSFKKKNRNLWTSCVTS